MYKNNLSPIYKKNISPIYKNNLAQIYKNNLSPGWYGAAEEWICDAAT